MHTKARACAECLEVALADGAKARDEAFLAAMTGKATRRFKDAQSFAPPRQQFYISSRHGRRRPISSIPTLWHMGWFLTSEWADIKGIELRSVIDSMATWASAGLSAHMTVADINCEDSKSRRRAMCQSGCWFRPQRTCFVRWPESPGQPFATSRFCKGSYGWLCSSLALATNSPTGCWLMGRQFPQDTFAAAYAHASRDPARCHWQQLRHG